MNIRSVSIAALLGAAACSTAPPHESSTVDGGPALLVDAGGPAVDAAADVVDDAGDHTFDLSIEVPCAASSFAATESDAGVPYGVSASWRMPDGTTFVRALAIVSTPRDEHQKVRFCFWPGNAARGITETVGFLTGDALYHQARPVPGTSCVEALVAGGLTRTIAGGDAGACDAGL